MQVPAAVKDRCDRETEDRSGNADRLSYKQTVESDGRTRHLSEKRRRVPNDARGDKTELCTPFDCLTLPFSPSFTRRQDDILAHQTSQVKSDEKKTDDLKRQVEQLEGQMTAKDERISVLEVQQRHWSEVDDLFVPGPEPKGQRNPQRVRVGIGRQTEAGAVG